MNYLTNNPIKQYDDLLQLVLLISHDFKDPLFSMRMLINTIVQEDYNNLTEATKENLSKIMTKIDILINMIYEIINYIKIDKVDENISIIDLEMLVSEITESLDGDKSLTINIQKPLPKLHYMKILVRQVFQNLISNGVKFNENSPIISICYEELSEDFIMFRITDNGIGIAEENKQNIFNLFNKSRSSKYYEGSGVGLAVVKKIVCLWGGQISVKSTLKKGSTFEFTIPSKLCLF